MPTGLPERPREGPFVFSRNVRRNENGPLAEAVSTI